MANSRRIYITLNSDKEKDKIIEELLSNSYSEADFIKETLYRLATQGYNMQSLNTLSTEKVQKGVNNSKKTPKVIKPKNDKKVQRDAESNLKYSDISTEKVQISDINTYEMQEDIDSDNTELLSNLSNNLNNYF